MWTDRQIKGLQPKKKRYRVSDALGQRGAGKLVLDILPNGSKTFFFQYYKTELGESRRVLIKIGQYKPSPSVPGITLSEARNKAMELSELSMTGDAKSILKAEADEKFAKEKQSSIAAATLNEVFEDYIASRDLKPGTIYDYRKSLDQTFKDYLNRPITDITRETVLQLYRTRIKTSVARGNNAMRVFRALYNYQRAITRMTGGTYLLPENPYDILRETRILRKINRRRTYIPRENLKPWFDAVLSLDDQHFSSGSTVRDLLIFLLLTGTRRDEARTIRKDQINLKRKIFTLHDTKNREVIELPMSDYLQAMVTKRINSTDSNYLFPSINPQNPIVSFKRPLNHLRNDHGLQFTFHDLRRTFITLAESLDISSYTIKKLVNHKISDSQDITAGYMIIDLDRMRVATQKVSNAILHEAGISQPKGNVISIKTKRKNC